MINALCVGGPADGRRVTLPDGKKRYDVVVHQPITLEALKPEPMLARIERYNFFEIHPVTRAVVFAHEDLTPTQIMQALMDGYRHERLERLL